MVKIFIGNVAQDATKDEIEALFTKYGTVTECAKYKNYAFVHMEDRKCATKAMRELHLHRLHSRPINVELSRSKDQGPVKLHIANVEKGFDKELRELFEEYGTVGECAIVKNFAFVHMNNSEEAMDAIKGLDNTEFQGKRIHVQISKSRPRGFPEEEEEEYPPPPVRGYYPAHLGGERPPPPPYAGRMSAFPPPPPPPPVPRRPGYLERSYGGPDGYVFDYYERYRAHPYAASAYDDRRASAVPPPPPPPSAVARERLPVSAIDPYERRALPPPPAYASRDRSPLRRPTSAAAAGNGYAYERARLSPVARVPMYPPPRPRDPYAERPALPPPAPRYAGY
ncbi:RNA-binding protein 4B-like [Thalassophryne amazonica]|uniref:RNA-binding protein 4B-like n=1 Tax=Thalassophryne amazonica TaxID=390379 RepID=UPI001472394E|nr:RNA-binding protein 4B-like [Thalassophryne amazonica]XP_034020706.1 RNA-binding protein 4B-like [Thalassophryne amazonica]XP_034020707.1 RNA-binding protein 4B-like [Thalassophryne amazonica]